MHRVFYIFIISFLFACNDSKDIKLTVLKDKIVFHNSHLSDQPVNIYIWDINENKLSTIPLAGKFKFNNANISEFIPDFPLLENTQYVLVYNIKKEKRKQWFSLPKKNIDPLSIESVYPTLDSLPENLLRMYIVFSNSMRTSGTLEKIRLYDEKNNDVSHAIFNNVYELWDKDQKRLTILFDPSRVKTGLQANQIMGRVLKPNQKCSLIIENVKDIHGQTLKISHKKIFTVIKEDISEPNTNLWKIKAPKPNTKEPLAITFPNTLDYGSLLGSIHILNQEGFYLKGKIKTLNKEKEWQFVPDEKWSLGNYNIQINTRLEDPSGNNLQGLFDHKIGTLKSNTQGNIVSLKLLVQ
ncbi:hypothetical protein [Aquimarina sp. 2201CG5-10]|uniref:hypothetical protein n=1 Tax=Aquimarina callyspongiae TaxID=3098150 RepID=UPI002AB3AC93|nr:hypothetical protein [Aquimarina sp. 2201CG5-10]MDY8134341.1 hypothetical protein [Aquimarina sp. 2201CG5-10]